MKYYLIFGLACSLSFSAHAKSAPMANRLNTSGVRASKSKIPTQNIYYWTGSINSNISIFIWAIVKDSLIQGEVTYTKTKIPIPIKLLGHIGKNGEIRVCEYQKDGEITGVFIFNKLNKSAYGIWASTKSDKEYKFQLSAKDTLVNNMDTIFQAGKLSGTYSYAFGDKGSTGGLTVHEIQKGKISFDISSVTSGPSYNVAEIETDTVLVSNNEFIYKVPDTDSCFFRIKFYKDFAFIEVLNGYKGCEGAFGLNATVEGIFYKTKK